MSIYYPDSVNPNSKDCPWNQKEPEICEWCDGKGYFIEYERYDDYVEANRIKCEQCNGEGTINDED